MSSLWKSALVRVKEPDFFSNLKLFLEIWPKRDEGSGETVVGLKLVDAMVTDHYSIS